MNQLYGHSKAQAIVVGNKMSLQVCGFELVVHSKMGLWREVVMSLEAYASCHNWSTVGIDIKGYNWDFQRNVGY